VSRRVQARRDLGEAISLENVLSLMVVLFVLRLLFFIPLISIDRMQLENVNKDAYWQKLSEYLAAHADSTGTEYYSSAFGLDGYRVLVTESGLGDTRYVEALNNDGTITVIEHRVSSGRFDALVVKGHSSVPTYRYGSLKWSAPEQVWFTSNDSIGYGDRPASLEMGKRFRAWTKQVREF